MQTLRDLDYRSQFPVADDYTYLNHAAVAPTSLKVVQAVEQLLAEFNRCGIHCYPKWMQRVAQARQCAARLIQAEPGEVAFMGNTSEGLSAVANGIAWRSGDVVLVPVPDFPSNIYPWMNLERYGVQVRFVHKREGKLRLDSIEKALCSRTRLLTVSSVDFANGYACDLEAFGDWCHRHGILFCVDAIQSLGVLPMDVKRYRIHCLAAGGHKWLLSTMGIAVLYVAKEVRDVVVHPTKVGWKSVIDEEDFFRIHFDLKPDASRFESGTMNLTGITAFGAAVGWMLEVGRETIQRRIFELNDAFCSGLEERGLRVVTSMEPQERSGILSFLPSSDPQPLYQFLNAHKVLTSLRDDKIRISPHFYNDRQDVEQFFSVLDRYLLKRV